jgi:serine/threonine protein kinase
MLANLTESDFIKGRALCSESSSYISLVSNATTGEKLALKIPKPGTKQTSQEFEILQEISHPSIIPFKGAIHTNNGPGILLAFAAGGDLFDLLTLETGGLLERECRQIFCPILTALDHLHSQAIWHRDIKPENILFLQAGPDLSSVVLADFGLARKCPQGYCTTDFVGSNLYVAPELLLHARYNEKIDIWALGITLYACLTGSSPAFGPEAEREILSGLPDLFNAEEADLLSRDAKDLIRWMLSVDPERRPSAKEAMGHRWFDSVRPNQP